MRRLALGAVAAVGLLTLAAATPHANQAAAPPQSPRAGTGVVMGKVVDAQTNTPLEGAIVSIGCIGANPPARDRVFADAQGRFVFFNVPPASHSVCATKAGYTNLSFVSIQVQLAEGQIVRDALIRMTSATAGQASIGGAVTDEKGEPIVGAHVLLLSTYSVGSGAGFWQAGGGDTDDRGVYRILATRGAGTYLVMVRSKVAAVPAATLDAFDDLKQTGKSTTELQRELTFANISVGNQPVPARGTDAAMQIGDMLQLLDDQTRPPRISADGHRFVYPSVFYPGTASPSQAARVTVRQGEQRAGVDIQVAPMPAVRISGTIALPDGPAGNLTVHLASGESGIFSADLDVATTLSDPSGRFTFPLVPSGNYVLKASKLPRPPSAGGAPLATIETGTSSVTMSGALPPSSAPPPAPLTDPAFWATMPITADKSDIDGVSLILQRGARVTGRLEFEGTAQRPSPDQIQRIAVTVNRPDGHSLLTTLSGGPAPGSVSGRTSADGQFMTLGLPPGSYLLAPTSPPGWTLSSAIVNGRDVSEVPLDVQTSDVTNVVVTYTDHSSGISGRVTASVGQTASVELTSIVIFPTARERWTNYGTSSRRIRAVRPSAEGQYTVDVPPGEYFAAAVAVLSRDWQDPKSLDQLSRSASRIRIAVGERKSQDFAAPRGGG